MSVCPKYKQQKAAKERFVLMTEYWSQYF